VLAVPQAAGRFAAQFRDRLTVASTSLPVFDTAKGVWRFVLHAQGALVRMAAPWLLAAFALTRLPPRLGLGGAEAWGLVGQLVDGLGGAMVGSRFVRRLVSGERWPTGPAWPDAAGWRYLLAHTLLALAGMVAGGLVGLLFVVSAALAHWPELAVPGVLAGPVVALWVWARLAPLPVFATTGRGLQVRLAFRLTRGRALRVLLVQLATAVPLVLLFLIGLALLGQLLGEEADVAALVVELMVRSAGYAGAALSGTALAAITVRLELQAAGGEVG